jgi:hypothetical protein
MCYYRQKQAFLAKSAGECGREGSRNDMEGKDNVGEITLSYGGESDGSVLACRGAGRLGVGRLSSWTAVSSAKLHIHGHNTKQTRKSRTYTSSAGEEGYEYACTHHFR